MNVLTFDLEDWFHILDHPETASPASWDQFESRIEKNTDRILSLLEEKNLTATWFCLGWIAKRYPALIKKISIKHEIGCHSMDHQLVYKQTPEEARKDIIENINLLEDISGKKIISYRAPGFSLTRQSKWLIQILAEAGIKYDASLFPAFRNHGGYPGFPYSRPCRVQFHGVVIKEFPMSVSSFLGNQFIFSGGGYFRLLPYPLISMLMSRSSYVMTYFHPRDFDPDQPVLESLTMKRKFMSYTGLKKSFSSLNRLLNGYKFIALEKAAGEIDWNETPVFNLEKY
jgi:polysaccharide deacetylase family protein (PEP-CTERM system associated)